MKGLFENGIKGFLMQYDKSTLSSIINALGNVFAAVILAVGGIVATFIQNDEVNYTFDYEINYWVYATVLVVLICILLLIHILRKYLQGQLVKSAGYLEKCDHANEFLEACKKSSNGIFLNVKVDFKNWFDPILQSHLAYQDVAIRYKQLMSLKGFDLQGHPFPEGSAHKSDSMGSPLRRVLFLTKNEANLAFEEVNSRIYNERLALQRCHWAMGIPIAFVTAKKLLDYFKVRGNPDVDSDSRDSVEHFLEGMKKDDLWGYLGFQDDLFELLKKAFDEGVTVEEEEEFCKGFDKDLLKMRDASKIGSDRVIKTIDCAIIETKGDYSLWGAAFLKKERSLRCRYYKVEVESLDKLKEECKIQAKKDDFRVDKHAIACYKKAIILFSEIIATMAFKPIKSALNGNGVLVGGYEAQQKFNPAIPVSIEAINEQVATNGLCKFYGNEFVYLDREPRE